MSDDLRTCLMGLRCSQSSVWYTSCLFDLRDCVGIVVLMGELILRGCQKILERVCKVAWRHCFHPTSRFGRIFAEIIISGNKRSDEGGWEQFIGI